MAGKAALSMTVHRLLLDIGGLCFGVAAYADLLKWIMKL
jgi:hypothetical protein